MKSAASELLRDLSSLLRMGMPVPDALRFLSRDDATPGVRRLAADILPKVEAGEGLAQAAGPALPTAVRTVIAFGERAEALPAVMSQLSEYLDETERLRARAREAMIYPTAVLVTCVVTALVLQYSLHLLGPAEAAFHSPPRFQWGVWFLLGAAACGLALLALLPTSAGEWLRWRLPYARSIARDVSVVSACRTISLALQAGMPLPEAVAMAAKSERNPVLRDRLRSVASDLGKGLPLSVALRLDTAFPPSLAEAVASAEGTEDLPRGLTEAAALYERVIAYRTAAAMAWLEPGLVIVMGGVTAAVLVPFWGLLYTWTQTL